LIDKVPHLPWGVEAPGDIAASKWLLFYFLFIIWTALTSKVLRKGDIGIEWMGLRFLELESARTVGKRV
jgi:hypothetical protein